ncbi:MAG: RidA family protein [Gammaproteobacteria bacterium]|nr:RidA family protein [Gammaproteobacteria bacterium]
MKQMIETKKAPAAIGPYSQAIKINNTVYLSGQIPLDPTSMILVEGDIVIQIKQVLENLREVAVASGGSLDHIVKLSVFLLDLSHLSFVNEMMTQYFKAPFPARTSIQVSALPKNAAVEIDAIMILA